MRVVLVGFMGSGKTTVGRKLSLELGVPFLDTDEEVIKRTGKGISEIFTLFGETYFRKIEQSVIIDLLHTYEDAVISTGGGLPSYGKNMDLINRMAFSVFLRADFDVLWSRISKDEERPLVKMGREKVKELYERRLPFYEKAHFIVDTGKQNPEEVVSEILNHLSAS